MGHGEIRKAIRELEDQQRADYDRAHKCIEKLAEAGHMEIDLRKWHDSALAEQVDKLESENAEIRTGQVANRDAIADIRFQFNAVKRPLEHRVDLQGQVDLLQKRIGEVDNEVKSQYHRALGEIDRLGRRVAILEEGNRDPDTRLLPEETQIQILGDFMSEEMPNEMVPGDVVCDVAIRLLKRYRAALYQIGWRGDLDESDFRRVKHMRRTAQEAHGDIVISD